MLSKDTVSFLAKLAKNNTSDWMSSHRDEYIACMEDFESTVSLLIEEIGRFDNAILASNLRAKNCIPKLNLDLRFAKDESTYKTYLYAIIIKGGRKSGRAVYFLVVKPGKSSIGAGAF